MSPLLYRPQDRQTTHHTIGRSLRIVYRNFPLIEIHPMAEPAADSVDSDIETLQRDGIVAHKGAFAREFVEQMREVWDFG
jgi:prephenate dehydrogenase